MRRTLLLVPLLLIPALGPAPALAQLCDYRLSQVMARRGSSEAVEAARAAVEGVPDPVLFITLNPLTGRAQFGATRPGEGANDTLLTRSARLLGAAASLLGADAVVAVGTAAVGAGLEAVCYFRDERITDYHEVLEILRAVDATMPPDVFALIEPEDEPRGAFIRVDRAVGAPNDEYRVRDLYIVNGQLLHRVRGRDEPVGDITIFVAASRG